MVARARAKTKKKVVADYDMKPGESVREWYARRAAEWERGFDYWMEQRCAAFASALTNRQR